MSPEHSPLPVTKVQTAFPKPMNQSQTLGLARPTPSGSRSFYEALITSWEKQLE